MSNKETLNLYKELQSSLSKDKMYWIQNDAKIRAVASSKNYDEFRDIVAAAYLKPLTKKVMGEKKLLSWNKSIMNNDNN